MKHYYYTVTVERTVVDTINLSVEAEDETEAYKTIQKAVKQFPAPLENDKIKHMYVENRETISSQLLDLERKVPIERQDN